MGATDTQFGRNAYISILAAMISAKCGRDILFTALLWDFRGVVANRRKL